MRQKYMRCSPLWIGGGYVAGVSGDINDQVPLGNFFTLLSALSVGKE